MNKVLAAICTGAVSLTASLSVNPSQALAVGGVPKMTTASGKTALLVDYRYHRRYGTYGPRRYYGPPRAYAYRPRVVYRQPAYYAARSYYSAPRYYAPPAAYYAPPVAYYAPPPVVYYPAPVVVYAPPVVYGGYGAAAYYPGSYYRGW
jgi:hypothetical protein